MVTFNCDVDVIAKAKERLENEEETDPTKYFSRFVLFCQVQSGQDVAAVASAVKARMNDIGGCTGLVIQYEYSLMILVETATVDARSTLMPDIDNDKLGECFKNAFVCSSEEGVERAFSDFRILQDTGEESTPTHKDIRDCDENMVVSILVDTIHGLLIEKPQTSGADKLLSQIAQSGYLFTREEFLRMYDVQMHICTVFEAETPQVEEIVVESDVRASLCASHVQKL